MEQKFNPAEAAINITLRYQEVCLILDALGKLPFNDVAKLYLSIQSQSLQTIRNAEREYNESTAWQKAADAIEEGESK